MYKADTLVRYIKGLGPQRSQELNKIGIHTVLDLLEKHPLSYVFPGVTGIANASESMIVIKAKIVSITRGYGSTVVGVLKDDTGTCKVIWYRGAWALQSLRVGWTATFWGKMKCSVLQNPKWTTSPKSIKDVYGGQYGETHHDTIRAAIKEVLAHVELPEITDGHTSWDRSATYFYYHFPSDEEDQQRALKQLKFDESLCLQTALAEKRKGRESVKGEVILI